MDVVVTIGHAIVWLASTIGYILCLGLGLSTMLCAVIFLEDREYPIAAVLALMSIILLRAGNVI